MRPTQHSASRESRGKRQRENEMNVATIFVKNESWLANSSAFCGVRFDTQIIPSGCWIAGFLTQEGDVITPPAGMTAEMQAAWDACLEYAATILDGIPVEEGDRRIL